MIFTQIQLPRADRRGVIHAEAASLEVPEIRDGDSERVLKLRVVRLPGRRVGIPLFFSDGGPGDDTIGNLSRYPERFRALAETGDVYFLDQRGSRWAPAPNLDYRSTHPLADGELVTSETRAEAWKTVFRGGMASLRSAGIEARGYTAPAIANDYVALADRLGIERFNFYGFSFGTQVGQLLLREHDSRLERILLWGLEPLDATLKLPCFLRAQLDRAQHWLSDTRLLGKFAGDLLDRACALRQRLDRAPVLTTVGDGRSPVRRLWFGGIVVDAVMSLAMRRRDLRTLPLLLLLLERSPRIGVKRVVRRFGLDHIRIENLQEFLVDGSLGASSERWQKVMETTPTLCPMRGYCQESFLALRRDLEPFDLGPGARLPATTDTPVYVCNGTLDANTPLENLPSVVRHLPNAHVLKIQGLDHRHASRSRPGCFREIELDLVRFLRGQRPRLHELSLPAR